MGCRVIPDTRKIVTVRPRSRRDLPEDYLIEAECLRTGLLVTINDERVEGKPGQWDLKRKDGYRALLDAKEFNQFFEVVDI